VSGKNREKVHTVQGTGGEDELPMFSLRKIFSKSATVSITSNLAIRALNVDEKKLIVQFGWKLRDEYFKSN
jgi:hypothetical protein